MFCLMVAASSTKQNFLNRSRPSPFVRHVWKGNICENSYRTQARLTGPVWRFRRCEWLYPEVCPPRCPSSRACSARTACSAAGCTCARGTAASVSPCWCRRRCESLGRASREPGGRAEQSCRWSPENENKGSGRACLWEWVIFVTDKLDRVQTKLYYNKVNLLCSVNLMLRPQQPLSSVCQREATLVLF